MLIRLSTLLCLFFFFFFSSRRRHTRCSRDWSSDVCSSDLSGTQCFAISQTGDPTGAYHRYAFDISPGMNDYPKIGVWSDGYYAMFHEFNPSFVGTRVLAFEKDKMIQGLPAQFVKFVLMPPVGQTWFTVQPPHIEGLAGPPAASPAPF